MNTEDLSARHQSQSTNGYANAPPTTRLSAPQLSMRRPSQEKTPEMLDAMKNVSPVSSSPKPNSVKIEECWEPEEPIATTGYARLAWLMARTDTCDLAIFRKFGELNMFNLLRLQAELAELQDMLRVFYEHDEMASYRYSFKKLRDIPTDVSLNGPQDFQQPHSVQGQEGYPERPGSYVPKSFQDDQFSREYLDFQNQYIQDGQHSHESHSFQHQQSFSQKDDIEIHHERQETQEPNGSLTSSHDSLARPKAFHKLLEDIKEKLKAYNEAILQVSQLESLEAPADSRSLQCLQIWLMRHRNQKEPKSHDFLEGVEEWVYHDIKGLNDFVAVRQPRTDRDAFHETLSPKFVWLLLSFRKLRVKVRKWFRTHLTQWFQEKDSQKKPRDEGKFGEHECPNTAKECPKESPVQKQETIVAAGRTETWKQEQETEKEEEDRDLKVHNVARKWSSVSSFIIAVLAALCPVISMVVLFEIKKTIDRLWTLIGLTLGFALAVKICTAAKSTEIFAVTAAFVAVEAIFIGSPGKS